MNAPVSLSGSTELHYYGVYEALVSDVNDPAKEGRVKIKMPWFDNQMETEWCRVRQFYAGNGYGAFYVPEVGDEVLIAFIKGNMSEPVILGGLYNGSDKPPSHRDDQTDEKLLRTKAGHEFVAERVGIEPSGDPFNAIVFDDQNRPFNPMVNAGAIACAGLIYHLRRTDAFESIRAMLGRFAGRDLGVDEKVFASEQRTGFRWYRDGDLPPSPPARPRASRRR